MSQATTFSSRAFWKRLTNLDGEEMEKAGKQYQQFSTNYSTNQKHAVFTAKQSNQSQVAGHLDACIVDYSCPEVPKKMAHAVAHFFPGPPKLAHGSPWEPLLDLTSTMGIYYHLLSSNIYYHLLSSIDLSDFPAE